MSSINLENICANYGYCIQSELSEKVEINKENKSKIENAITKSHGVLEHDGVYALFLYLSSKMGKNEFKIKDKDLANKLFCILLKKIKDMNIKKIIHNKNCNNLDAFCSKDTNSINYKINMDKSFKALRKITEDQKALYLIKTIFEKSLIYARYHVKALEEKKQK